MTVHLVRRHRRRSTMVVLGEVRHADYVLDRVSRIVPGEAFPAVRVAQGDDYAFLLAGPLIELREHLRKLLIVIDGTDPDN